MHRHIAILLLVFVQGALTAQPICQIQGTGTASGFDGQMVTTEGIVTALFTGTGSLSGYFIEQPDCDSDPATSNGIFVYDPTPGAVAVGQRLSVTGTVDEFNGVTELTNASAVVLGMASSEPTAVALPVPQGWDWERLEGMYLRFPEQLTVTDNTGWVQYGELYLSPGRLVAPTNRIDPNDAVPSGTNSTGASNVAAVNAAFSLNERSYILLDDGRTSSYPMPSPWADPDGTLRTGSTVEDLRAVLHFAYGEYRLQPVGNVAFQYDPRPDVPVVGGGLKAASINLLNYFTTLGDWGAANQEELDRQRTKLVAAMAAIDADVLALCELENSELALTDLLDGVNNAMGAGTYAGLAVDDFGGGTRMAIFYKPSTLTPVTQLYWLGTGIFQRRHLTQGFEVNNGGDRFLFSTMHLRSKLCDNAAGPNLDQGDGQGCFNDNRRAQANALVQHWAGLRASTGIQAQLILGDHNAYTEEDPLDVMRASGLVHLLDAEERSYSYLGMHGALDHAFGTASMHARVTGAQAWHINSDEPAEFDYADANLVRFQPNAYRCSDHDPLVVGFNPAPTNVATESRTQAVHVVQLGHTISWSWDAAPMDLTLEIHDARGALVWQGPTSRNGNVHADLIGLAAGPIMWRLLDADRGRAVGVGRLMIP